MKRQRGNILFLILLAIILFVALNYAVIGSQREKAEAIPKEKARAFAAQLIQNAGLIESNMMRARTVDGIPDYGFDVSGSTNSIQASANATCTIAACKIYSDNGGGVPPLRIPLWASTSSNTNLKGFYVTGKMPQIGSDAPELVLMYRNLQPEVCNAINEILNITVDLSDYLGYGTLADYTGTLTSFPDAGLAGPNAAIPSTFGRKAFCANHSSSKFMFVYAVIER